MNSKGIVPIKDESLCMKCLTKKATHKYRVNGRGYGSILDGCNTTFQCCCDCNESDYHEWFSEKAGGDEWIEEYQYEENISNLIKSLPLESQELFWNSLNYNAWQNPQDWIDYKLGESSYSIDECDLDQIYRWCSHNIYNANEPERSFYIDIMAAVTKYKQAVADKIKN